MGNLDILEERFIFGGYETWASGNCGFVEISHFAIYSHN